MSNLCTTTTHQCNHEQDESKPTVAETVDRVRPAVDIVESDDAVVLSADVPGADDSSVQLEVDKGTLKLTAKTLSVGPSWLSGGPTRAREYVRSFRLSDELDAASAEASVANGVLSVRLPKKPEAVPTKIAVRHGQSG